MASIEKGIRIKGLRHELQTEHLVRQRWPERIDAKYADRKCKIAEK